MELKLAKWKAVPERIFEFGEDSLSEAAAYTAGFEDGTEEQAKVTLRQALQVIDEAWPKDSPIYQDKLRAAIEQLREASK